VSVDKSYRHTVDAIIMLAHNFSKIVIWKQIRANLIRACDSCPQILTNT
jgi:hypothetical protein